MSQYLSLTHMPKPHPLVCVPRIGHPTCYSVNDLALGSPAAEGGTPMGLHFSLFPQFLLIGWSTVSIKLPFYHCSLPYPHPPGLSSVLRPRVYLGPGEGITRSLLWLLPLSPVPSHFSTCSKTWTYMDKMCPHYFKSCKKSLTGKVKFQILNILE